jgi:tetratricopeptide (TPR) repeat protein
MARDGALDIFLSYAAEDIDAARALRAKLVAAGWNVFLAGDDLGLLVGSAQWSERIDQILDSTTALVLLVTQNALRSRWVSYEWRSVHDAILSGGRGMLIPVCWSGVAPEQLPRALRRYQCVDARESEQREASAEAISTLVRGYLDPAQPNATLAPVALSEPARVGRSRRRLRAAVPLVVAGAVAVLSVGRHRDWLAKLWPSEKPSLTQAAAAAPPPPGTPPLHDPKLGLNVISIYEQPDAANIAQIRSISAWSEAESDFEVANRQPGAPLRWQSAQQLAAGERAMLQGSSGEAEAKLRRAIEIEPGWATAYIALSGVLLASNPAGAIAAAEDARARDPASWQAIEALANGYQYKGDRERALEEYQRALALQPDSALLKAQLAIALHSAGGKYDGEAEQLAHEALDASDQLVAPRLILAELALERGEGQQAVAFAQAAAILAPRDVRVQLALGDALQLVHDDDNARAAWTTALRLRDSSPMIGVASARLEEVATALQKGRMPKPRHARSGPTQYQSGPRPKPRPDRSGPHANLHLDEF